MRTLLLVALLIGVPAASSAQDRVADRAEIQAHLDGWEAASNRGEAVAISAFYDAEADRTFAHGIVTRSRPAILEAHQE